MTLTLSGPNCSVLHHESCHLMPYALQYARSFVKKSFVPSIFVIGSFVTGSFVTGYFFSSTYQTFLFLEYYHVKAFSPLQ